jgi:hypothetical protein
VDARPRRTRDRFVPLILFGVRGRIVDNPILDTQAHGRAMEENHRHAISSALLTWINFGEQRFSVWRQREPPPTC